MTDRLFHYLPKSQGKHLISWMRYRLVLFSWPRVLFVLHVQYRTIYFVLFQINKYHLLLTQYHHLPTSAALYWPSTTKYQPVAPLISLFATHLMSHHAQCILGLVFSSFLFSVNLTWASLTNISFVSKMEHNLCPFLQLQNFFFINAMNRPKVHCLM